MTPTAAPASGDASIRKTVSANDISIQFPRVSCAEDTATVSSITRIINKVYADTEGDLFLPGYQRTNDAEVAELIRKGTLAVGYVGPDPNATASTSTAGKIVGCVYVSQLSPSRGSFGMLAVDSEVCSGGLGRALVRFAEDHCRTIGCTAMQLELLVPTALEHPFKARLQAWYLRMGYRLVKLGIFGEEYPTQAALLIGPTNYEIYEKELP